MAQTDGVLTLGGGSGAWIFRVLLVAATAFMVYSWFQPWWVADVAVIEGTDDLVLHPWGVEVVRQVRVQADPSLYAMPSFFTPFVWTYFGVAMAALFASLFVNIKVSVGRIKLPLAAVLIALVGLSYLTTVGLAYWIGNLRADGIGVSFIGDSEFADPMSHRKMKMESDLRVGYWYALYAGAALFGLSLIRFLFVRGSKA
ncbi:MAG: hypothetical protein P8N72_12850 [Flavimaricola sp.]|nr:hypothetical protein [Flavimaricola sp.]